MSYNRDRGHGRGGPGRDHGRGGPGRDHGRDRKKSYESDAPRKLKRRSEPTKPVELDKIYEVVINEITGKGDGIARVQGFIIFVENGKIGNNVRVKVTEVADRFAKATIEP
ncbi:MAG TPA: TRAM domain-containing protein [Nitrososphaeraceae archaeon]|jgi:predicted RNA-binding protein with TRAM domain|nr:TRAM domain-containing protein [Nitrososphaeraceae archaeon]